MRLNVRALAVAAIGGLVTSAAPIVAQPAPAPLYKDPSQPIDRRVDDLLRRMTLEEKVAQMEAGWEHKDKIQTPDGTFSPENASRNFPDGIGQIARPSDHRGVTQSNGGAG